MPDLTFYLDVAAVTRDTSGAGNLIPNPGVESDASGYSATGGSSIARDTAEFHSGAASLRIETGTGAYAGANYNGDFDQGVTVASSTAYSGSLWFKGSNSGEDILLRADGNVSGYLHEEGYIDDTTAWRQLSLNFTTGGSDTQASLRLIRLDCTTSPNCAASRTWYLDDLTIGGEAYLAEQSTEVARSGNSSLKQSSDFADELHYQEGLRSRYVVRMRSNAQSQVSMNILRLSRMESVASEMLGRRVNIDGSRATPGIRFQRRMSSS